LPAVTDAVLIDPANREQLKAWDGDEGAYWAAHADHFERAAARYDEPFFAAASVGGADRILDVGCGTGKTTRDAARLAPGGSALGVDLSAAMLDVARQRAAAEGIGNVGFEQADAQVHSFEPETFDIAIGRTSAMFFADRVAALANVGRAVKPGGRLVLMTWQSLAAQEWIGSFTTALAAGRDLPMPPPDRPGPFTLAEPDVIRSVLSSAGYTGISIDGRSEPMWFGTDAGDAYEFVLGMLAWMTGGLDEGSRQKAQESLRATIAAHETAGGVMYDSSAWIVSATRA
jgi:SAM-dependent methyltransferase